MSRRPQGRRGPLDLTGWDPPATAFFMGLWCAMWLPGPDRPAPAPETPREAESPVSTPTITEEQTA